MGFMITGLTIKLFCGLLSFFISEADTDPGGGTLLFQSGFNDGVYVTPLPDRVYYFWDIRGKDIMDWERDLEEKIPFVDQFYLNFVHAKIPDNAFADLRPDPDNPSNQVLYFENRSNGGRGVTSRTQSELLFNREEDVFKQGFIRYRFRLHENLEHLKQFPGSINWFVITEWWEHHDPSLTGNTAGKSRVKLSLYKDEGVGQELFWHIEAQETQPVHAVTLWELSNRKIPVTIGEWFTLETFFRSGDESNGKVWVAIVPQGGERIVLFDIENHTQHRENPLPLRAWQSFKLYTRSDILDFMTHAGKPVAGYYDDFEFWNYFPPDVK